MNSPISQQHSWIATKLSENLKILASSSLVTSQRAIKDDRGQTSLPASIQNAVTDSVAWHYVLEQYNYSGGTTSKSIAQNQRTEASFILLLLSRSPLLAPLFSIQEETFIFQIRLGSKRSKPSQQGERGIVCSNACGLYSNRPGLLICFIWFDSVHIKTQMTCPMPILSFTAFSFPRVRKLHTWVWTEPPTAVSYANSKPKLECNYFRAFQAFFPIQDAHEGNTRH